MTFDPFGDFENRGYLRNFFGSKDIAEVKTLEHVSFQGNIERAMTTLAKIDFIEYKHVLATHKILFGDIYPWAGQDRLITAPNINITKGGYDRLFAHPQDVRRATEYALEQGRDPNFIREHPQELRTSMFKPLICRNLALAQSLRFRSTA